MPTIGSVSAVTCSSMATTNIEIATEPAKRPEASKPTLDSDESSEYHSVDGQRSQVLLRWEQLNGVTGRGSSGGS